MANTLAIKRRIKSVGNVKQITRAMELTAAAKMHKAQIAVLGARPYATRALELVHDLEARGAGTHPLLEVRPLKNQLIIVISSDSGLAGGLNASLVREVILFHNKTTARSQYIFVGKKGLSLTARFGLQTLATFTDIPTTLTSDFARPISLLARDSFLKKECDAVFVIYNHFQSTLVQKATVTQLLPFTPHPEHQNEQAQTATNFAESVFEPNAPELLQTLLPRMVDQLLFQILLEAGASEHAARMVAMHNATDNASDLLEDLNLTFNGIRQTSITTQMAEISSSVSALEE